MSLSEIHPRALLLVEDDPQAARSVARALELTFEVTVAASFAAAVATQGVFSAAVLDIDLGDGDGVALARLLLAEQRVPSVIFYTGSAEAEVLGRAAELGTVVAKRSGIDVLLREVERVFGTG